MKAASAWCLVRAGDAGTVVGVALLLVFALAAAFLKWMPFTLAIAGATLTIVPGVGAWLGRRLGGPKPFPLLLCVVLGSCLGAGVYYVARPAMVRAMAAAGKHLKPSKKEAEEAIRSWCLTTVIHPSPAEPSNPANVAFRFGPSGFVLRVDVNVIEVGESRSAERRPEWPVKADVRWLYYVDVPLRVGTERQERTQEARNLPWNVWRDEAAVCRAGYAGRSEETPAAPGVQAPATSPGTLVLEGGVAPDVEILAFPENDLKETPGGGIPATDAAVGERLKKIWQAEGVVARSTPGQSLPLAPGRYTILLRRTVSLKDGHFYQKTNAPSGMAIASSEGSVSSVGYLRGSGREQHVKKFDFFRAGGGVIALGRSEYAPDRCKDCTFEFPDALGLDPSGPEFILGTIEADRLLLGHVVPLIVKEPDRAATLPVTNPWLLRK